MEMSKAFIFRCLKVQECNNSFSQGLSIFNETLWKAFIQIVGNTAKILIENMP